MYPSIPEKLQSLYSHGYKLVPSFHFEFPFIHVIELSQFLLLIEILILNGHQVIFTNESNIDRWKNKRQAAVDSKIGRLNSFIKRVEVPIQVKCGLVFNY